MHTLPELSIAWGKSLDALRKLIYRDSELRKLGQKIGPTRYYTDEQAERIRAAVDSRTKVTAAKSAQDRAPIE